MTKRQLKFYIEADVADMLMVEVHARKRERQAASMSEVVNDALRAFLRLPRKR